MRQRITLNDFIKRSNIANNYKYDYSLVDNNISTTKKIIVICPIHGEFQVLSGSHMNGLSGCKKCEKDRIKNIFLTNSHIVHGNKYDYSLVDYKNNDKNIKIICPEHGIFIQVPHHHTQGSGCPKCNNKKLNNTIFIDRSNKIHGNKYDYSLVDYKGAYDKIKIICPEHGIFEQRPCDHMNGNRGCPICGGTIKSNSIDFIKKANKIHKNKYDYSLVDYNLCTDKIQIICKKHGKFEQLPHSHLSGYGCPICNQSKGENIILNFLKDNEYNYIYQKRFKTCKNKIPLPFDFYLSDYDICIEFDGIQHILPIIRFGGEKGLIDRKYNDKIKNDFCEKNNIKLLRINYDDDDIIEKLKKYLKKYGNTTIQTLQESGNFVLCFSEFGK